MYRYGKKICLIYRETRHLLKKQQKYLNLLCFHPKEERDDHGKSGNEIAMFVLVLAKNSHA